MEIPRFDDGHAGAMLRDHLHPAGGIDLHQGVGDEDDVHSVQDAGQSAMPEADLSFEVQHADSVLALGVAAGLSKRATVGHHRRPGDGHAHHGAILVGGVFDIRGRVVGETRRR